MNVVTVESTLSGAAQGELESNVQLESTVDSLIAAFCIHKGIRQRPQYILKNEQNMVLDNVKSLAASGVSNGDVLYLTTKIEEEKTFGFNNWWTMAAIALAIGIVGLVAVTAVYSLTGHVPNDYGIVFDAGSSHTSMVIYKWKGDKDHGTGCVTQVGKGCTAPKGGISNYAEHPEEAGKSLKKCLDDAVATIHEKERRSESRIFLGATAGMRILNISHPDQAAAVMASIDETLINSGFSYTRGHAKIITGQEEGIFAWITSNYLMKFLDTPQLNTVGALDLGGASTQIAFAPEKFLPADNSSNYVDLELYGNTYKVFSKTFLCYGKHEVERRFHVELVWSQKDTSIGIVENPCSPKNSNYSMNVSELFDQVCTFNWTSTAGLLPLNESYTFIGTGNITACKPLVDDIINISKCRNKYASDLCFDYSDIPQVSGKFVAVSTFCYVANFFNFTEHMSLKNFTDVIDNFCKKTWDEVKVIPGDIKMLLQYCLDAQYMHVMLTKAYKFKTESHWNNISFLKSVDGSELGWTLGFMTNTTNMIPAEKAIETIGLPIFIILVIAFILFIAAAVAFAVQARSRSRSSALYERLTCYGSI